MSGYAGASLPEGNGSDAPLMVSLRMAFNILDAPGLKPAWWRVEWWNSGASTLQRRTCDRRHHLRAEQIERFFREQQATYVRTAHTRPAGAARGTLLPRAQARCQWSCMVDGSRLRYCRARAFGELPTFSRG